MSTLRPLRQPLARLRPSSALLPSPSPSTAASPSHNACATAAANFSTSPVHAIRRPKVTKYMQKHILNRQPYDHNPNRGVSPMRRSDGSRWRTPNQPSKLAPTATKYGLPEPVLDPEKRTKVETDENHGLWGFFRDKKVLSTPEEDYKHGRAWTAEELRRKSWDDLHCLWWACVKEQNIIYTQHLERERLKPGYGQYEAGFRASQVSDTQRAIKYVLTERYYSWMQGLEMAENDPEINLSGRGQLYTPRKPKSHKKKKYLKEGVSYQDLDVPPLDETSTRPPPEKSRQKETALIKSNSSALLGQGEST